MTGARHALIVAFAGLVFLPAAAGAARRSDAPIQDPKSLQVPIVEGASYDDHLVVPGQRMGRIRIGMGTQELADVAGPPSVNLPWAGNMLEYRWDHFSAFVRDSDQKVVEIRVNEYSDSIEGGLTFNSTRRDVLAAWGRPDLIWHRSNTEFYWYRRGISMSFSQKDDTINTVSVCIAAGVCY